MVSSMPPRLCGVATFALHLGDALAQRGAMIERVRLLSKDDGLATRVGHETAIRQEHLTDYTEAARRLNFSSPDCVVIQHEYGLFGGEYGSHLLALMDGLQVPAITVMHTVLPDPDYGLLQVTQRIAQASRFVIVMCDAAARLMHVEYEVPQNGIVTILHGYPEIDAQLAPPELAQFDDQPILLSLGLLSPNKGIKCAVRAVALALQAMPNLQYFVVGRTHPGELVSGTDRYRRGLECLVQDLRVGHAVHFIDRYTSVAEHIAWIQHAQVVLLPHRDLRQVASGTLAYAIGCGRPAVTSAFAYAEEMTSLGAGVMIAGSEPRSLASAVLRILSDSRTRENLQKCSAKLAARTSWATIGEEYLRVLHSV